jgi:hypothetical protein
MLISKRWLAVVAGISVVAAPIVASAAPLRAATPVHAFLYARNVSLTLRNDTGETLMLKVGDKAMTIDAGKSADVKAPAGTAVVVTQATAKHAAGEQLLVLSSDVSGATLRIS